MTSRVPSSAYTIYDDAGNSVKAEKTAAIATGAATAVVKNAPGRVISALVTTAGTSGDNATITDGASGTVLAVILGSAAVGAQVTIDLPAAVGIVVVNVASGPAFTIGYN
jgi:hypothetical protein